MRILLSHKDYAALIVTSLYLLHMLRGINSFYSIIPFSVCLLFFLFFHKIFKFKIQTGFFFVFSLFVFLLPIIMSFIWYPGEEYLLSFSRYLFMAPFFLFCLIYVVSFDRLKFILKIYAAFVVIGGLSIFYQVIFGSISWFADASEREGLIRYSSLLGSLTSYGILAGLALPIIFEFYKGFLIKFFLLGIVSLAMLFTLQKAAIINFIFFFVYVYYFSNFSTRLICVFCFLFIFPLIVFCFYFFDVSYVVATIDNVFRFKEGSGSSDVAFFQSILDRLWLHPSFLYDMHGFLGMLFGVGMVGGSGMLGFPEYPMAHNGFFDLLFIGGFLFLLLFFILFYIILFRVIKVYKNEDGVVKKICQVLMFIVICFLINIPFSGLLFFHPYGAVVFYPILALFTVNFKTYFIKKVNNIS